MGPGQPRMLRNPSPEHILHIILATNQPHSNHTQPHALLKLVLGKRMSDAFAKYQITHHRRLHVTMYMATRCIFIWLIGGAACAARSQKLPRAAQTAQLFCKKLTLAHLLQHARGPAQGIEVNEGCARRSGRAPPCTASSSPWPSPQAPVHNF